MKRDIKRVRLTPCAPQIPQEIVHMIFQFAGGAFVLRTGRYVCKGWLSYADDDSLWEGVFTQQFPWISLPKGSNKKEEFMSLFHTTRKRTLIIKNTTEKSNLNEEFALELLTRKWVRDPRMVFLHKLLIFGFNVDNEDTIPVGFSKFGGKPDLPRNYTPNFPDGYLFYCQINLNHANFFVHESELLPPRGMLYIFLPLSTICAYENYNWVIYLSPEEIKQHGGLERRNIPSEEEEETADEYSVPPCRIEFRLDFEIPRGDGFYGEFTELNADQLQVLQSLTKTSERGLRSLLTGTNQILPMIVGYEPDCISETDHFLFDDDYFLRSNFINMKTVPLTELLEKEETSISAQTALDRFNARYPNEKSDVIFKREVEDFNIRLREKKEKKEKKEKIEKKKFITIDKGDLQVAYKEGRDSLIRYPEECIFFSKVQPDQVIAVPTEELRDSGFEEQHLLMTTAKAVTLLQNDNEGANSDEIARCVDETWKRDVISFIPWFSAEEIDLPGMQGWNFGIRKGDLLNQDICHIRLYYHSD
jgi:hypothetical protein